MNATRYDALARILADWDAAMITSDADQIGALMVEDGVIVGADGSVANKQSVLDHIRSGTLTHDVMAGDVSAMRFEGDCATVIAWGVSGGCYTGVPFRHRERSSNFFAWQNGRWR